MDYATKILERTDFLNKGIPSFRARGFLPLIKGFSIFMAVWTSSGRLAACTIGQINLYRGWYVLMRLDILDSGTERTRATVYQPAKAGRTSCLYGSDSLMLRIKSVRS